MQPDLRADTDVIEQILGLTRPDDEVYLVGGPVRDRLLNRAAHDLDFAVRGNAVRLARRVANRLGGAFYVLDAGHDTARVLLNRADGGRLILDFAGLRSEDLSGDLLGRDFTVNAMALSLRDPDSLIDPLGGAADLRDGVLRACTETSLSGDPVRVLRAVRMAMTFQLHIEPQTLRWMKEAADQLGRVSAERKRDELFRLLGGHKVAAAVRMLDQIGALQQVLPELDALKGVTQPPPHEYDVWEHTLQVLNALEKLFGLLVGEYHHEAADLIYGTAVMRIGRYRQQLAAHFDQPLHPERTVRSLLFFSALYHDIAKPDTRSVEEGGRIRFLRHEREGGPVTADRARQLALSRAEVERAQTTVSQHMRVHHLVQTGKPPTRRALYRFWRTAGPAGVEVCLLSLADTLAKSAVPTYDQTWQDEVEVVRSLLEAWYERKEELVAPPRLISGTELQQRLGMSPGPNIGRLLDAIREKQAEGMISTADEAWRYAEKWARSQSANHGGQQNES